MVFGSSPPAVSGFFVRAGFGRAAAGEARFYTDEHHPNKNVVSE
jgi:hypothetical protein